MRRRNADFVLQRAALEVPQRGVVIPNPSGGLAIISRAQSSFETQKTYSGWELLNLGTGKIRDQGFSFFEQNEIVWLLGSDTGIIYLKYSKPDVVGGVALWMGDVANLSERRMVASLNAPYAGLKVPKTSAGNLNLLMTSLAYPNDTASNPKQVQKPRHTGRLYQDFYPRLGIDGSPARDMPCLEEPYRAIYRLHHPLLSYATCSTA